MRDRPLVGLSLMLEDDFRVAAAPLFAEGEVDAIEWSFDMGSGRPLPPWADALLAHYSANGRLFGHGVHYSPLSARWEPRQQRWLERLAEEVTQRSYVHVSEHYGFMTAEPFTRGAPLPVPRSERARAIARDRLGRLRGASGCPIGIENLALAWNRDEVLAQGAWLESLLPHDDDFILLDVHNLYCQLANFDLAPAEIFASLPLARVREIHVSGGSDLPAWPDATAHVRCDTHDDRVPEPVFALLTEALRRCPHVSLVVLERLGGTIEDARANEQFASDFRRVRRIVEEQRG